MRKPKFNKVKLSNYSNNSSIITEKVEASWNSDSGSQSPKHLLLILILDCLPRLREPETTSLWWLFGRVPPRQLALIFHCCIFLPDGVPRGRRGILILGCTMGWWKRLLHLGGRLREGIFQVFKLNLSILLILDQFFLWGQCGGNALDYSSPLAFRDQDLYCLIISCVVIFFFFSLRQLTFPD